MYIDGLDDYDNKILNILKNNARMSYSEIGEQVGLSRVSVKNRMEILEEKGIIQGYAAIINPTALPDGRRFFVEIVTEPNQFEKVVDMIAKHDVIRKVYAVTGECRLRAEGFAANNMKYETFVRNVKCNSDGIRTITIQDAQFTIKDVDGGVDYVSLADRRKKQEQSGRELL